MDVFLTRERESDHGTEGRLVAGDFECYTLELPWRDNQSGISCIPAGEYPCEYNWSNGLKRWCYLLGGTTPRAGVRIHSGNYAGDKSKGLKSNVLGCILLGMDRGILSGQRAVLRSAYAVRSFQGYMGREPFTLHIEGIDHA